jgi:hypothetical protein
MAKKRTKGFYWHVHHDSQLLEWCYDYEERLDYIKNKKPENERELRIKLFQPIKGRLPKFLLAAGAKYDAAKAKFDAARAGCDAARAKYDAAKAKFDAARAKFDAAWTKYIAAGAKYDAARAKFDAAGAKYDAARAKCAAQVEALHKKECPNCPWDGKTIFTEGA